MFSKKGFLNMIKFDSFSLLQRGYFPKELPYNFNTFSFALMTKEMIAKLKEGSFRGVKGESLPITFTIPRGISSRRNIAIPNPWNYLKIVSYIEDKEKDINNYFSHTEYSLSFPVNSVALAKRCLVPCSPSFHYFRQETIKRSIGKNVILKLDINNFYPSVYTHAIEWAFTGKDYAKEIWASKGKLKHEGYEIGEKIDELIRKSQSDETHGIPIGPDVSFLVGEFILCKVDEEIHASYPNIKGFRYYDDYTFFVSDEKEAKSVLNDVQIIMYRYGIDINERKVEIKTIPCQFFDGEMGGLLPYRELVPIKEPTLIGYFDTVWTLASKNPKKRLTILSYALKTLFNKSFDSIWKSDNKELLDALLLKTISIDPTIIPIVHGLFVRKKTHFSHRSLLKECIDGILAEHIPLHNHIEILWALWMGAKYGITLDKRVLLNILELGNSVCSLQTLAYINDEIHKEYKDDIDIKEKLTELESSFDDKSLYGDQWLLLYESNLKGWLNFKKIIDKHSFFKYLQEHNVSFFDANINADYTSASYLKERLFTIPGSDEFEKAAIEQADQLWSKVKLEFYEKSGLSGHLDEKDYEAKFSEDMPDDEVLTDLFTRIMLINAHLSDESLEDVEAEMVRRLSSFFQY